MNDLSENFSELLRSFGWAPGGYMFSCADCGKDHQSAADKRAFRCKPCAEKAVIAHIEALQAETQNLRERVKYLETPVWFWPGSDAEGTCETGLWDVIDAAVAEGMPDKSVLEVQTGRPLKPIWCAVQHVGDYGFKFTEYKTEREARKALKEKDDD